MFFLKDLPVLVLGLGDSGLAMARWCARCGAKVTVWDSREQTAGDAALATEWPAVQRLRGELLPAQLNGVQLVLKSPGLAPNDARVAPLLDEARAIGIAVLGELDLFARALADLRAAWGYAPKLLAITGTNGKTTTTAMTALLVARAGRRVAMAGNIGPTLLGTLSEQLAELPEAPVAVAEEAPEAEPVEAAEANAVVADAAEETEPAAQPETVADTAPAPLPDDDVPVAEVLAQLLPAGPAEPEPGPADALPRVWVLELSSFQLEGGGTGVRGFEPAAGTVLNLTQDHLDWHGSMAAYSAAKARVFGQQAMMVINRDDPLVEALVPQPVVPAKGKAKLAPKPKPVQRNVCRFGLNAPQQPGDFGLVEENGMAWLVRALPAEEGVKRKKGEVDEIHLQRLMPADALRVRGRHNAANALAALALATAIGCPLAPMLHGLREYAGEPHRVEFVARVPVEGVHGSGEVEAFDDSKGTNVGATVAALNGLGADKAPGRLVVILGGDGKGQDFTPLRTPLAQHARAVATLGRDAGAIEEALLGHLGPVPVQRHATLEAAVAWCFEQAQPGDAVLLSPACASLDMFRNYAHRAEVFVAAVQALAAERGALV
ncbi:UDP-N-acetylmuramoyl-L-alanine--D-glutamate ligase [Rubrivivax rivuli]|uniref:UDP-N-acetylmuramoylalanine--D-glutamate ligase n=1 Tax=Rubrivivax rivuli TaxID=1862385 RepID=A0A437RBV5_9BURK|nr:UDP-N-acetylmuramoyl-L-alanine--D-glutamate ligase [Rubrivivax rivuli]RVU44271.1 UDP-N-acetylmuramoyl-L-alanine--D-glutamate ligase [Rubrivivax rivuli]